MAVEDSLGFRRGGLDLCNCLVGWEVGWEVGLYLVWNKWLHVRLFRHRLYVPYEESNDYWGCYAMLGIHVRTYSILRTERAPWDRGGPG